MEMKTDNYSNTDILNQNNQAFFIRQAVERLREGLFDPAAINLLTVKKQDIETVIKNDLLKVSEGECAHLAVCGNYGQGKSHNLHFVREYALNNNFAVSYLSLDPRETPLHRLPDLFRALMLSIQFPGKDNKLSFTELWKKWAAVQIEKKSAQEQVGCLKSLIPKQMPHLMVCTLTAAALKNIRLSQKQKRQKKHIRFKPKKFPWLINRVLYGEPVSSVDLNPVFKYRNVSFYRDAARRLKGKNDYFDLISAYADLFRNMGYNGWVLLFDEGESVTQTRVSLRAVSYENIYKLCGFNKPVSGLYSLFAFTDDFFDCVDNEDYEKQSKTRNGEARPLFKRNYQEVFNNLNIYRLADFTSKEWSEITKKLISMHSEAYGWKPDSDKIYNRLYDKINNSNNITHNLETRRVLKNLVNFLDCCEQEQI